MPLNALANDNWLGREKVHVREASMATTFIHDQQRDMMEAADSTDGWFNQEGATFRIYYICMRGDRTDPCGTMVLSDIWDRRHEGPLAVKQRWYCKNMYRKIQGDFGGPLRDGPPNDTDRGVCLGRSSPR